MTKTLDINGKITISIDPDSQEFADRAFATLSALDKQHQNLLNNRPVTNSLAYDIFSETNKDIRRQLDELLNSPVCDALFGKDAVFGGIVGSSVSWGIKRGFFSNGGHRLTALHSAYEQCKKDHGELCGKSPLKVRCFYGKV